MQWRVLILACLLGAEILLTSIWFDGATLKANGGLTSALAQWGPSILRWGVGFAGLFCCFAYLRHQAALKAIKTQEPVSRAMVALHAGLFALFLQLSRLLYGRELESDAAVVAWSGLATGVLATAALAFFPWAVWTELLRVTGSLWAYSALAAAAALTATPLVRGLWEPTTRATFWLVKLILSGVVDELVSQPERMRLGTPRFGVIISPECSGLEGIGLLLIFGVLWLVLFRDELRFPRALLLLPAGVGILYLANALRIAALVLIGDAGAREIAVRGFHSQAGWISFNLVAFGLLLAARRIGWFRRAPMAPVTAREERPAAPFLMPLLAILAAGMISGAMSGGFEWFYGLRVLAGGAALWFFRKDYARIDFRCGWQGPAAGVIVFVLWVWGDTPAAPMPAALVAAPPALSWAWIVLRVIGGTLMVPVAEELAFRGFGLRRLIAEDFESVPWRTFTWPSLLISSLLFGLMHGERWLAGIAAGIVYALVMLWRGRLGDAVVAHGVTNGFLAIWVLVYGRWELW